MPGRRRRPPRGAKRTNELTAEKERLERELQGRVVELERERDFVATVVDSTSTLFCVLDSDGLVLRYNNALARLSGRVDDDEVRGRPFWDTFVVPKEAGEFRRRLASGDEGEHETGFRKADGTTAVVAWSHCPIVDAAGSPRTLFSGVDVTERRRQTEQLRASRARIVEAADAARRKIERDLHDGAQQRLVALSLMLRGARGAAERGDSATAVEELERIDRELATALEELRELARGIHPAALTEQGLAAALETLAVRSPVPVEVEQVPRGRLTPQVEAAVYYVVSEALTNVAKYAHARVASVRVFHEDGYLVTEVEDDGVGGAEAAAGSGLRGLSDRVEALDGSLEVESPRGGPTLLRARIRL